MTRRAWLLFAALGVIWGLPYLLIKVAIRDLPPPFLVLTRTGSAALLLLPLAAARRELRPVLARWRPLVAYTAVELAVPWLLLATAEQHLSSSLSGLVIAAVPLVGALLARTTGARERLGPTRGAGLLLGVAGVGALVGLDVNGSDAVSVLELGAVVCGYALGPWIFARHLAGLPPLGVVTCSLVLCATAYLPALFDLPARVPNGREVAAMAVLVVACTAVAFLIFFALITEAGAARATVITYVNPAVALVGGVAFLGERFRTGTAVGFVLILAGSFLATRRPAATASAAAGAPGGPAAAPLRPAGEWPAPPIGEP